PLQSRAAAVPGAAPSWRARLAPLALAASLVLLVRFAFLYPLTTSSTPVPLPPPLAPLVGFPFLYQLTTSSTRVLAAELAADHFKCFALNDVLRTHDEPAAVESSMLSWFDWRVHLPADAAG